MPKPALHTLRWSVHNKIYTLLTPDQQPLELVTGHEEQWFVWLATHSSFSFQGQSGHLNVLKEERKRGAGYWYAYHSEEGKRNKRYLGPRDRLTLAFLEQVAKEFSRSPASSAFAQPHSAQQNQPRVALLASKLSPPHLPLTLVQRSRLLDELEAIVNHPLTLVSASAGSGKTTLLSAWVAAASSRWRQEQVCAWLSLEGLDNDPTRFWTSIIVALRTRLPTIGEAALSLLSAREALPLPTILLSLLQEIEQRDFGQEIILILDDYHVISEQALQEALCFFLDHLPANLHLVLISRTDPELPLSRLRVRHQLLEIRDQELRFTQQEAACFLVQCMGLALSEGEVAILHQRTMGWIAGLQLAALSLSRQQNPSRAVVDFGGSHRYLLDYVQQDILRRLPGVLQDFLLKMSVVTRMNAALCQAITASSTLQESQQRLEEVERANLFVVSLDARRQWYRYHDLFREALQARLQASLPDLVPLLHQRAARWYEMQGELPEAITHALAASDASFSVSYACNRLEEASNWLLRMLQVAQDWQQVELLVRGQIYSVRLALAKGDLPQARRAGQKLEALIEQDGFALHAPWISAVRVQVWLAEGNLMEASAWAARTTFSEGTWNILRRCELLMLARVLLAQQQNVLAAQTLERFRPYCARPAALQTEVEWTALAVLALHRCGKREQALQEATRLLTITEPEGYVRLDLDTGEPLMKEVLTIWLEAHPEEVSQASTVALSRSSVLRMLAILERDTTPAQESESLSKFSQNAIQHISLEPLSRQEQQVLRLLATGQTYAEMARTLVVSINTIKTQVSNIYRKLGVSRRADAIAVAARMHLV